MNNHWGYDKYERSDYDNTRNGSTDKKLITENGVVEIEVPLEIPPIEPKPIKKDPMPSNPPIEEPETPECDWRQNYSK